MSTFAECLQGHLERGTLTKKQIDALELEYDNLIKARRATGNDDPVAATTEYMRIKADRLAQARYARTLHFFKTITNRTDLNAAYRRWQNSFNRLSKPKQTLMKLAGGRPTKAKLYRDLLVKADQRGDTLMAEFLAPLKPIVEKHSRTMNPFETKARLETFEETIRVLMNGGEATGEVAEMAGMLRQLNDLMVREYRSAGGIIGKVDNYAPQVHNLGKILPPDMNEEDAFTAWKDFIWDRLDRDKMQDFDTGQPLTDERLEEVLGDIFDSITGIGEQPTKPGFAASDVFARRERMRQLHFRDGDSFLEYNNQYGVEGVGLFDAYFNHVAVMARDIGIMQVLGPKAKAAHKTLLGATEAPDGSYTDSVFKTLIGPSPMRDAEPGWLKFMEGTKNIVRSSLLDMSGITALNDVTFAKIAADMHGMRGFDALAKWMRNIAPGSQEAMLAQNAGHHISSMLMAQSISMARAMEGDGLFTSGWTVGLNNWTQRASLMHHVTEATANTISQTYSFELGGLVRNGVRWNDLDARFRDLLDRGRISESEWNEVILKATPQQMGRDDGFFVLPEDVASIPLDRLDADNLPMIGGVREIARKLSDIDISLRFEATNAPNLKTRAISTLGSPAADPRRQAMSAIMMFKSFPIQVMQNHFLPHLRHTIEHGLTNLDKGGLTRAMLTVSTLGLFMGMTTIQLKELSKGKTPRALDQNGNWLPDAAFVRDAMIISGFGGLMADLLLRDREGRPLASDLAGPWVGLAEAPLDIIASIGDAVLEENDYGMIEQIGSDVFRTVRTYIPAADLPYYQFATERMILDNIAEWISPDLFHDRNDRLQSRVMEPRGQEFWLDPATP